MQNQTLRTAFKRGFLFFSATVLLLTFQFLFVLFTSNTLEIMSPLGYLFFFASCLSHAACLALAPYLIYMLIACTGCVRIARVVHFVLVALLVLLVFLDAQVYAIYRFHINGFVLNMVFGPGAGEIFTFDTWLYLKEVGLFLLLLGMVYGAYWLSGWVWRKRGKAYVAAIVCTLVGSTLFAHLTHIYGAFMSQASVVHSAKLLPYYFPTTAYSFMTNLGFKAPVDTRMLQKGGNGTLVYPIKALQTERPDSLPNIVLVLLDSWNKRSLTPQCMPNTYRWAQQQQWFDNHLSASNGTRSGVFGLFYGLTCYYWEDFEAARLSPVFIDRLQQLGYDIRVYPSAPIYNPNFAKVVFGKVKGVRVETAGKTSLERDQRICADFIGELPERLKSKRPLFSFVFFDLPHSFELDAKHNVPFAPAWPYADYTKLNNDMDPTPFFNLYLNTCHQDDILLGKIFQTLEQRGMLDNTIVILSGDHGQEFNENKKNYWGHNGNFSAWQLGVPLICHFPGAKPQKHSHRTTHYDIVPTLMHNYLGVKNPVSDYSMGHLLSDNCSRKWHIVGSNLNYAFIIGGDSILEKNAEGGLDVYDARMNPVSNYRLDTRAFNKAMDKLNKFYK